MLIETGTFSSNASDPAWNLDEGTGERKFERHINFTRPFKRPPDVQLGLTGLDFANSTNARLGINPARVNESGFDVSLGTWADTKIFSVAVSWTAYGD